MKAIHLYCQPWIAASFFCVVLLANDWRSQPAESWSWQDVLEILNNSPWVRLSSAGFAAPAVIPRSNPTAAERAGISTAGTGSRSGPGTISNRLVPFFPAIRLITAKPIRDALLRQSFLQEFHGRGIGPRQGVDVKTLSKEPTERAKDAQERFSESNPILAGDPDHIVVSITFVTDQMNLPEGVSLSDLTFYNPLEGISLADLMPSTLLSTKTGKHIVLSHYLPPGKEGLGARFFFSRKTSNGIPSIIKEDKELRFETRIKGKKIEVEFDLSKLLYQGKLEL